MTTPTQLFVLGTGDRRPAESILQALRLGYRRIDSAAPPFDYNEDAVGTALAAYLAENDQVHRSDFHVQTRLALKHLDFFQSAGDSSADQIAVQRAVECSLARLRVDYIDCLLINAPGSSPDDVSRVLHAASPLLANQISTLGLSNINDSLLRHCVEASYNLPRISIVQNRFYWYNDFDTGVRDLCLGNNIQYQAFGVLRGNNVLLGSRIVKEFARQRDMTVEGALYCLVSSLSDDSAPTSSVAILNGSRSLAHMESDLQLNLDKGDVGKELRNRFRQNLEQISHRLLLKLQFHEHEFLRTTT